MPLMNSPQQSLRRKPGMGNLLQGLQSMLRGRSRNQAQPGQAPGDQSQRTQLQDRMRQAQGGQSQMAQMAQMAQRGQPPMGQGQGTPSQMNQMYQMRQEQIRQHPESQSQSGLASERQAQMGQGQGNPAQMNQMYQARMGQAQGSLGQMGQTVQRSQMDQMQQDRSQQLQDRLRYAQGGGGIQTLTGGGPPAGQGQGPSSIPGLSSMAMQNAPGNATGSILKRKLRR